MADKRLRRLYRQAIQDGDIEAQAHLLFERVRVGDLDREMLRLAAHCGHPASRLALGKAVQIFPDYTYMTLREWVEKLAPQGKETSVRVAIAAAAHALHVFESEFPGNNTPRKAIVAAIDWICHPCQDHVRVAAAAAQAALDFEDGHHHVTDVVLVASSAGHAAYAAGSPPVNVKHVAGYSAHTVTCLEYLKEAAFNIAFGELTPELTPEFLHIMNSNIIPWALCIGEDPILRIQRELAEPRSTDGTD